MAYSRCICAIAPSRAPALRGSPILKRENNENENNEQRGTYLLILAQEPRPLPYRCRSLRMKLVSARDERPYRGGQFALSDYECGLIRGWCERWDVTEMGRMAHKRIAALIKERLLKTVSERENRSQSSGSCSYSIRSGSGHVPAVPRRCGERKTFVLVSNAVVSLDLCIYIFFSEDVVHIHWLVYSFWLLS